MAREDGSLHCRSLRTLAEQMKKCRIAPVLPREITFEKSTPLHFICNYYKDGDLDEIIAIFIELGVDPTAKNPLGLTALDCLCHRPINHYNFENLLGIIQLFVREAENRNMKILEGSRALGHLIENYDKPNLVEVVQLHIEGGADVNSQNSDGRTPISILCEKYENENLHDIIELMLVDGRVDPNLADKYDSTPLHYLCDNYKKDNLIDIIQLFFDAKVDVNVRNELNVTAFVNFCYSYDKENLVDIARLFVTAGVDLDAADRFHRCTALHHLCERYPHEKVLLEIVELFKSVGFGRESDDEAILNLIDRVEHNVNVINKNEIIDVLLSLNRDHSTDI